MKSRKNLLFLVSAAIFTLTASSALAQDGSCRDHCQPSGEDSLTYPAIDLAKAGITHMKLKKAIDIPAGLTSVELVNRDGVSCKISAKRGSGAVREVGCKKPDDSERKYELGPNQAQSVMAKYYLEFFFGGSDPTLNSVWCMTNNNRVLSAGQFKNAIKDYFDVEFPSPERSSYQTDSDLEHLHELQQSGEKSKDLPSEDAQLSVPAIIQNALAGSGG